MIIYGSKGAHVRTAPLPAANCPSCSTFGTVKASVYSRYAHIYWIPLFPFSKSVVTQCDHCQQGWEEKDLPAGLLTAVRELKQGSRFPIWNWLGLAIIVGLIGFGAVAGIYHDKDSKTYLAAPRAGDLYTIKSPGDSTKYSLLKVVSAKGNALEVVVNEYETDSRTPQEEIDSPEKYSKESESLTVFDLKIMHNQGRITDVNRPDK